MADESEKIEATPERIERALRVLAYLEAVQDYEPLSASEWLECADELPRPGSDELDGHDEELWEADPNCKHVVIAAAGGGVKCTKCPGWFCY